ncbi:MAG: hypothetical protein ACE5JP_05795 [Candidatus Bipolaricaulia bacterium]
MAFGTTGSAEFSASASVGEDARFVVDVSLEFDFDASVGQTTESPLEFDFSEAYVILFENSRFGLSSFDTDGTPAEIFESLGEGSSDFDGFGYSLAMDPFSIDLSVDLAQTAEAAPAADPIGPQVDVLVGGGFGPVAVTLNAIDLTSVQPAGLTVNATASVEMPMGPANVYAGVNATLTPAPAAFFALVGATIDIGSSVTVEFTTDDEGDGTGVTDLGVSADFSFGAIDLSAEATGLAGPNAPLSWEVTVSTALSDVTTLSLAVSDEGGAVDVEVETSF